VVPAGDRGERHLSERSDVAESPCVGVCHLRAGTRLCDGCLRTVEEITEWSAATNARRLEILASVSIRKQQEAAGAPDASRTNRTGTK
jgi:uncharacterized protein